MVSENSVGPGCGFTGNATVSFFYADTEVFLLFFFSAECNSECLTETQSINTS